MALPEPQQVKEALSKAKNVLITFPAGRGSDAIGSSLALASFIEKLGKRVDIVAADFHLPGDFRFLPQAKRIANEVTSLRKFIISVNLAKTDLQDLSYSVDDKALHIFLTPKQGGFDAADITHRSSDFTYDLIITVDTPDLDSLDPLYHNNTEFFFDTTIINLDHAPTNEQFGQINLVNFNVPATAEVVFELMEAIAPQFIDADAATCLYTSLSAATRSFTSPQITPATLSRAAQLVTLGARREEVVTHLYRTKQLTTLKLWGRALARIKSDTKKKLVWSLLQPDDFIKAGAGGEELPGIIDELMTKAPEAGTIALLYEVKPGATDIFLHAGAGQSALDLLKPFDPTGNKSQAQAKLTDKSVLEAERIVIEYLRQLIPPLE